MKEVSEMREKRRRQRKSGEESGNEERNMVGERRISRENDTRRREEKDI